MEASREYILSALLMLAWLCQPHARAGEPELPFEQSAAAELFAEDRFDQFVRSLAAREARQIPYWRETKATADFLQQLMKFRTLDAFIRQVAEPDPKSDPLGAIIYGFIKYRMGDEDPFPRMWHLQDVKWSNGLAVWLKSDQLKRQALEYMVQLFARSNTALLERGLRDPGAALPGNEPLDPLKPYVTTLELVSHGQSVGRRLAEGDEPPFSATVFLRDLLTTRHSISRLFWHGPTKETVRQHFETQLGWVQHEQIASAASEMARWTEQDLVDGVATPRLVYLHQEVLAAAVDLAIVNAHIKASEADDAILQRAKILNACTRVITNTWSGSAAEAGDEAVAVHPQAGGFDALRRQIHERENPYHTIYPRKLGEIDLQLPVTDWHEGRRLLFLCEVLRRMEGKANTAQVAEVFILASVAASMTDGTAGDDASVAAMPSRAADALADAGVLMYPDAIVVPSRGLSQMSHVRYVLLPAGGINATQFKSDLVQSVATAQWGDALLCRIVLHGPEEDESIAIVNSETSANIADLPVRVLKDVSGHRK